VKKTSTALLAVIVVPALHLIAAEAAGERWWSYVKVLAADNMDGRNTGSPGYRRAADYVAREFREDGLEEAGTSGFFQSVPFDVVTPQESGMRAALLGNGSAQRLTYGDDLLIATQQGTPSPIEAPLVFIGYGLPAKDTGHDDFAAIDLRGKFAVFISGAQPNFLPGNVTAHYSSLANRKKALLAAGAVGAVRLMNPASMDVPWPRIRNNAKSATMFLEDAESHASEGLINVTVNPDAAAKWFASSGHSWEEVVALAKEGKPLPAFPMNLSLQAETAVTRSKVESPNVIGVLRGSDPQLKSSYVTISAHLDHLGIGSPINGDSIFNGTMDNASGVAALLEIAKELHDSGQRPRRSLLFLAVTGEEKGLLGSKYFTDHPTVPIERIVADFNFDMFLPIHPMHVMTAFGIDETSLGEAVRRVAEKHGIKVQDDPYPQRNIFIRSDQYNFVLHGIPSAMCMDGSEKGSKDEEIERAWLSTRYHAPSDDLDQPVDLGAAAQFNSIMKAVLMEVANDSTPPTWKTTSFFKRFAAERQ
jgi:hypothetical protein